MSDVKLCDLRCLTKSTAPNPIHEPIIDTQNSVNPLPLTVSSVLESWQDQTRL